MFLIVRMILQGIGLVNDKMKDLVSNHGNLTKRIEIKTNDEVGEIGDKLNRLLEYIHVVISNIATVSSQLTISMNNTKDMSCESVRKVERVSATIEEMSAMMQHTYANVEQITSIITGMKQNISEVYQQVGSGQKLSNDIFSHVQNIVSKTEDEAANVTQVTEEMTRRMNDKIEESGSVVQIEELTSRILDIAEQTRLLALNASIEAAHAGKAGRGFSVVAEQITQLSNNSSEIAKEIQSISKSVIQSVETLANESEKMLTFATDKTMNGYRELMEVGADYYKCVEVMKKMFGELENKMGVLESGMDQIMIATSATNEAMKENTDGITEAAETSRQLSELMKQNNTQVEDDIKKMNVLANEVSKFVI